MAGGCGQHGAY